MKLWLSTSKGRELLAEGTEKELRRFQFWYLESMGFKPYDSYEYGKDMPWPMRFWINDKGEEVIDFGSWSSCFVIGE